MLNMEDMITKTIEIEGLIINIAIFIYKALNYVWFLQIQYNAYKN